MSDDSKRQSLSADLKEVFVFVLLGLVSGGGGASNPKLSMEIGIKEEAGVICVPCSAGLDKTW